MRIVIATRNSRKAAEMRRVLERILGERFQFPDLSEYPQFPEPEESADTYAENAAIKARAACDALSVACISDDAGLEVDALGGAPGVKSKRFGGEDLPFSDKMRLILERMNGMPAAERGARFRCAVAFSEPNSETRVFESTCEGQIAAKPRGSGGFGYDPIFLIPEKGKTFAEMSPEEKDSVSHRGKVLADFAEWLRSRYTAELPHL
ncbi:MAG: dITP/XTP pyrophosphatase [Fimbriimonadales bacterium]|nr:dITP/XTP pyrophosphatase [Fimbriimonadales bacterium]